MQRNGRGTSTSWKSKLIVPVVVSVTVLIFIWILFVRPLERKLAECEEQSESLLSSLENSQDENTRILQLLDQEKKLSKSISQDLDSLSQDFDAYKHTMEAEVRTLQTRLQQETDGCVTSLDNAKAHNAQLVLELNQQLTDVAEAKRECVRMVIDMQYSIEDITEERSNLETEFLKLSEELQNCQVSLETALTVTAKDILHSRIPMRKDSDEEILPEELESGEYVPEFYDDGDDLGNELDQDAETSDQVEELDGEILKSDQDEELAESSNAVLDDIASLQIGPQKPEHENEDMEEFFNGQSDEHSLHPEDWYKTLNRGV